MEKQTEQQDSSTYSEHHQEHHPTHHPEHHPLHHPVSHSPVNGGNIFTGWNWALLGIVIAIMIFNQVLITSVSGQLTGSSMLGGFSSSSSGTKDLSKLDIDSLKSTGHTVAAVFPVES